MSLKFNPFDQKPKGNLVKRRKVFEAPHELPDKSQNSTNVEPTKPDSNLSGTEPFNSNESTSLESTSGEIEFSNSKIDSTNQSDPHCSDKKTSRPQTGHQQDTSQADSSTFYLPLQVDDPVIANEKLNPEQSINQSSKFENALNAFNSSPSSFLQPPTSDIPFSKLDDIKVSSSQRDTQETQPRHTQDTTRTHKSTSTQTKLTLNSYQDTDRTQSRHNQDTFRTQTSISNQNQTYFSKNQDTIRTQLQHNQDTNRDTHQGTDNKLTGHTLDLPRDIEATICSLKGQPLQIFCFCCEELLARNNDQLELTYDQLSDYTNVHRGSVENVVKRMCNKTHLLKKSADKGGVGALIRIWTDEHILFLYTKHRTSLIKRRDTNRTPLLRNKQDTFRDTNQDTSAPSMYVGINKNTIHTEPAIPISSMSDEWTELREVDFSTLSQWNIKESVVDTFKKNKWLITREQLEDFIERFIRYFTEPEYEARRASIRSPYSLFLNSVKTISNGEPDPICDVKTQFDIEREIALKNKQKQLEENKRRFEALEKDLDQYRESEFNAWASKLTQEEQIRLVPPQVMAQVGSVAYRQLLKVYYTEKLWPEFKQSFLNGPRA